MPWTAPQRDDAPDVPEDPPPAIDAGREPEWDELTPSAPVTGTSAAAEADRRRPAVAREPEKSRRVTATPSDSSPPCPTCGNAVAFAGNPTRPFCSVACKLIDLGAWLDEAHRVPGPPLPSEAREPDPPSGEPAGRR